jgi:hypothetical protein
MTLETLHERNSAFTKEVPGLQIAWDSTSLGLLKTCPRKYYYNMIEGWNPKDQALPLIFGIWFHSALEHYDKFKALGASHDEATEKALRFILCETGERKDGVWKPWTTDCSQRNRLSLIRAVVWYLEHFKEDPAKTIILADGKPAVELSFKMEIPLVSPNGDNYLLCGHLDRVVEFADQIWVMDRKTTTSTLTDYYFSRYSPDNQMSLYTLSSRIVLPRSASGVIIDACQLLATGARFQRSFVNRTNGQVDEWMDDIQTWIKIAEGYAKAQHWPMNDTACDKYGGCKFREVCNKDPKVRKHILSSGFEKRIWNPLEARE